MYESFKTITKFILKLLLILILYVVAYYVFMAICLYNDFPLDATMYSTLFLGFTMIICTAILLFKVSKR